MNEWRSIKSAPDDEVVDLWVRPPSRYPEGFAWKAEYSNGPHRIPDCRYDKANDSWIHDGNWITGRIFYEDGDQHFDPSDKSDEATIATHWMYPPDAPEDMPEIEDLVEDMLKESV